MLNSFLNQSVERFVILLKHECPFSSKFNVHSAIYKDCIYRAILMQVYRLRLLGDYHHSTRIAFVEFVMVITPSLFMRVVSFSSYMINFTIRR